MLNCSDCGLELTLDESWHSLGTDRFFCRDRELCRTRVKNQAAKDELMRQLRRIESEPLETFAIIDEMTEPCTVCGERREHPWHNAMRCSWCKRSLGLVASWDEASKLVNGWCPECKASWLQEIERDMGR